MLSIIYDNEQDNLFKLFCKEYSGEYTLTKREKYITSKGMSNHIINISKLLITVTSDYKKIKNYCFDGTYFEEYISGSLDGANYGEISYLNLLYKVLNEGDKRETRNGITRSIFHANLSFDLSKGFPLLTTKAMFFRGIVEETLMFLRGETNTETLSEKGIKIWEGNTEENYLRSIGLKLKERDMGPMYGFQFYHYGEEYISSEGKYQGYNQIDYVINVIKNDPTSRRILMTSFNPKQAKEGCLYPCHSIILQFYVEKDNKLSLICYNRSQDLFLGVPWNISYAALFVHLICEFINDDRRKEEKLSPGMLYIDMGDVHIYEDHIDNCIEQLIRIPYNFPILTINQTTERFTSFKDFVISLKYEYFNLAEYKSHSSIKSIMIV